MVAVDTNILVRLLVNDDPQQHRAARALFAREAVHLSDTVLLETEWVLRDFFDQPPSQVCRALRSVCALPNVSLRDERLVAQALDWHEAGMDFADAMPLAASEALPFRTFDRGLIRIARRLAAGDVAPP